VGRRTTNTTFVIPIITAIPPVRRRSSQQLSPHDAATIAKQNISESSIRHIRHNPHAIGPSQLRCAAAASL
jgi:hypothetical protein